MEIRGRSTNKDQEDDCEAAHSRSTNSRREIIEEWLDEATSLKNLCEQIKKLRRWKYSKSKLSKKYHTLFLENGLR